MILWHAPVELFRACSVLLYLAKPEPAAIICYLDTYCPALLALTAGQINHECSVVTWSVHNADVTIVRWRASQCGVCRSKEDTASTVSGTGHIQVVTPIQHTPAPDCILGQDRFLIIQPPTTVSDLSLAGESTVTDIVTSHRSEWQTTWDYRSCWIRPIYGLSLCTTAGAELWAGLYGVTCTMWTVWTW